MPKGPTAVGIDVGGTTLKLGLVRAGKVLYQERIPTASVSKDPQALVDLLVVRVRSLAQRSQTRLAGVGVGIPGLVDYPQGVVRSCANLAGWKDVPLKRILSRRLSLPVQVDNDANAMTLAEWGCGAGRGSLNLVCLTLGTGVGGGFILNGELYHSRNGPSAEIGHLPLARTGPGCSCGGQACLERYVGNQDLLRKVRRKLSLGVPSLIPKLLGGSLRVLSPELIDLACERGDPFARLVWEEAGFHIGLALVQVVNLLNPDRIVIGGGIAKAGRWLFPSIRQTVRRRAMRWLDRIPIVPAKLGSSAGLLGAAFLVREGLK